ncbi:MAG: hypothetical protein OHK0029_20110 [Armatimonadaceae bacterium]
MARKTYLRKHRNEGERRVRNIRGNISPTTRNDASGISFGISNGPHWTSFEKFRVQGREGLLGIQPGSVGTLSTPDGTYRILREDDFQHLLGLAREADRIRGGIRMIRRVATFMQEQDNSRSGRLLLELTEELGEIPALPTRRERERLTPENLPSDQENNGFSSVEDDDVELNPAALRRPLRK